jgi:signal recognition particle subunit SRP54
VKGLAKMFGAGGGMGGMGGGLPGGGDLAGLPGMPGGDMPKLPPGFQNFLKK